MVRYEYLLRWLELPLESSMPDREHRALSMNGPGVACTTLGCLVDADSLHRCSSCVAVGFSAQAWPGFGSKGLISERLAMTTCFSPCLGVPLGSKFSVLSV